jgi:DNA-binding transcriptional LysR family regulator
LSATDESEVASHLLVAVPFEDGRHTKPVAVIYRKTRALSPAMTRFVQFLRQPSEITK